MASIMIKVAGEGAITKAHRTADIGPTSGSSVVYEIQNVPEGVSLEDVIDAFRGFKPADKTYEYDYAALKAQIAQTRPEPKANTTCLAPGRAVSYPGR